MRLIIQENKPEQISLLRLLFGDLLEDRHLQPGCGIELICFVAIQATVMTCNKNRPWF
jgi:hypothetical protein